MIEIGGGLLRFRLLFFGHVAFPSPCLFSFNIRFPMVTKPPNPKLVAALWRVASGFVTKREAIYRENQVERSRRSICCEVTLNAIEAGAVT